MKPGVSRLSNMQSPGRSSKSRFKSFKRSLLSFVRSPTAPKEKKARKSFPTPATTRTAWECPSTTETPNTTSTRRAYSVRPTQGLPPPPFVDPSVGTPDVSSAAFSEQQQQQHQASPPAPAPAAQKRGPCKRRVFKDGKLIYEWEQNSTHATLRLPASWTFNARNSPEQKDIKVLIAPSFLQVGIVHKKKGQKARIEWKLHHTTGGTIHVESSTWTTPDEHQLPDQGTIITLCKAKTGVNWAYALLHNPREEMQTKLCRPPRTKQRRPKTKQEEFKPTPMEETPPSSFTEHHGVPESPAPKKRKKKKAAGLKKKKKHNISSSIHTPQPQESDYFQEKQQSGRRSGGEYSFKSQDQEQKSSSTHSTKPVSDEASFSQHPISPRRRAGEYSMKPISASRINIYETGGEPISIHCKSPTSPRRSSKSSLNTSYSSKLNDSNRSMLDSTHHGQDLNRTRSTKPISESSLFFEQPKSPRRPKQKLDESLSKLDLYEAQEAERRASTMDASRGRSSVMDSSRRSSSVFSRASSTFNIESPKRFSKPTSRISMEIKTPTKPSSSRSIDNKSPISAADKPASRISMQLKKRISNQRPDSNTILVQSKASKMNKRRESKESRRESKRNNKQSLDFVDHSSEVEKAFPHKPYPKGKRTSLNRRQHHQQQHHHHKRASLNAFLEKPSTHSHTSGGTNFKSVATANTSSAVVQNLLQGWTASGHTNNKNHDSFSKFTSSNQEEPEEAGSSDDFMQELEMSYSRMNSLM
ncbi:MAG: hypothetical protein SGBAC_006089 [Bacillariaceae sp.]